ncbi:glucosaminidase domain-containing protein [Pseudemcibacter aquimaris]|uniref:glucosaminidase domain-containing protein n=1 Tax=Pseudemcibacter aquimaris TaxID=2857064 RepID=UPI0020123FDB|nr:glucosaminidase domain-containing protein [Pseudemcibacter aquimaris]MCC3860473.1 glucosaminidase domain-containing protein [Pseudemcibacter aquimaris]WDU59298.1 glucosaminidase domain-containing protein [Pseudemcibacter aquimaris]
MASSLETKNSFFGKKTVSFILLATLFLILPLSVSVYQVIESRKAVLIEPPVEIVEETPKPSDIQSILASYGYDIIAVRRGHIDVPPIFLNSVPTTLSDLDVTARKNVFISIILPLILKVNDDIQADRELLSEIMFTREFSGEFKDADRIWLEQKMKQYQIQGFDIPELYSRMNIIPPSLAITQAAIETGWGTSRFATEANALYGQWTWDDEEGMVPLRREAGKTHTIKVFDDLLGAVKGYAMNLNTHPAYEDFRIERRRYEKPEDIKVSDLLITLIFYSELGFEYIDRLNNVIRANSLEQFDHASLRYAEYQEIKLDLAP